MRNLKRLIIIVGLLSAAGVQLYAQNLDDKRLKGVVFFKKQAFLPDTNVSVYEYRYVRADGPVLLFTLRDGTAVKSTRFNDTLFVPYPGRGEADYEEAKIAIQIAQKRFPEYTTLLGKVDKAWEVENRRAPVALVAEQRRTAIDRFYVYLLNFYNNNAPLKKDPLPAAALPADKSADSQQVKPSSNPMDFEKNLKVIQEFYKKGQEIE